MSDDEHELELFGSFNEDEWADLLVEPDVLTAEAPFTVLGDPDVLLQLQEDSDQSDEELLEHDMRNVPVNLIKVATQETVVTVLDDGAVSIIEGKSVTPKLKKETRTQSEFAVEYLSGKVPNLQLCADMMKFAADELGLPVDYKFVDPRQKQREDNYQKALDLYARDQEERATKAKKRPLSK